MVSIWRRRRAHPVSPAAPPEPAPISDAQLRPLFAHLTDASQPNVTALRQIANRLDPISFNIKQQGYALARQLAAALPHPTATAARHVGLASSLATQAAIESDWAAHWCAELGIAVLYHRKVWEICFVLQALYEHGMLVRGRRGLGFGCGTEPLPSYFAAAGIDVTATDLPPADAAGRGWMDTGQHASHLDQALMPHLVDRATFERHVGLRFVDMNAIPADLTGYDFCWSICALEHLGSIRQGLDFVENAVATLRPGGVAVHTTEFNIRDDGPTIDNWPSVAFQRGHLEELAERLRAAGHEVAPFDFALGNGPLDRFIDIPPYSQDLPDNINRLLGDPMHLKLDFDGLIVTCAGLIVRKGG